MMKNHHHLVIGTLTLKKFYGSWDDGHLGAGLELYKSGDFPALNKLVDQDIAEIGDEEDEGGVMDIISDYIPKHLVRIGNFDADGFIIQADEPYAKLAARYFLKDILKNEWPVYIDTDKNSFSWEMPIERQKLTTWLSS